WRNVNPHGVARRAAPSRGGGRRRVLPLARRRGGREGQLRAHALGVPARARRHLSDRVPVAVAAAARPDRAAGDSPGAGSAGGGAAPARRGALPPRADTILDRRRAHGAASRLRPGRGLLGAPHPERGAPAEPRLPLGALPVAGGGGTGIPGLSVGRAAARGGVARDPVRAGTPAAARCRAAGIGAGAISPVVAAVPPDLPVGHREADERRPHVAQSHGARLPLLDAAAPHLDRLVRESAPGRRQEADGGGHLSARDRRPVPYLRAPPRAARGLRGRELDADPVLRDWELQLLQCPYDRPLARAGRRRRVVEV